MPGAQGDDQKLTDRSVHVARNVQGSAIQTGDKSTSIIQRGLINVLHTAPSAYPDEAESAATTFAQHTQRALRWSAPKVAGLALPLQRAEVDEVEAQLALGHGVLLAGESGTGKSGLSHALTLAGQERGRCVLFIDARTVHSIQNEAQLRAFYSLRSISVAEACERLGSGSGFRLVIDQLDSVADSGTGAPCAGAELVELAIECAARPNIEVVVVSRSRESNETLLLKPLRDAGLVELKSRDLDSQVVRSIFMQLNIAEPSDDLVKLGRNLLHMSLIAQIRQSQPGYDFSNVLGEIMLWQSYMDVLQTSESVGGATRHAGDVIEAAYALARRAAQSDDLTFSLPRRLPRAEQRLRSQGMIERRQGLTCAFRHESMQAYLWAKQAVDEGISVEEVNQQLGLLRARGVLLFMDQLIDQEQSELQTRFLEGIFNFNV